MEQSLHPGQRHVLDSCRRWNVVACGRRWGKTTLGILLAAQAAQEGFPVAWGAPHYKYLAEAFRNLNRRLKPFIERSSRSERRIELRGGGSIDFWTLNDSDAGRGHKYKRWLIDEAAMVPYLDQVFQEAIQPTLLDLGGDAWMLSTPKGRGFFFDCFTRGQDSGSQDHDDWKSWQMPTSTNPLMREEEIERVRRSMPAKVFAQEILAEFGRDDDAVFDNIESCTGSMPLAAPEPSRTYVAGIDLARHHDYSVISILDDQGRQVFIDRFRRISWSRQVERVVESCQRFRASATVDATGVGDPVIEQLTAAGLAVNRFTFTAASKQALIDRLALAIETGSISLLDHKIQTAELTSYQKIRLPGGGSGTSAPPGSHDDCVIALALANWQVSSPGIELFTSPYLSFFAP